MKKKGFTLVELLAVIVILALLALITGTAVTKLVKDSKQELSDTQIKQIKSAAQAWGVDNIKKLPSSGSCIYITLGDLKDYGLLDSSIIDSNNNQEISDDLKIKISTTTSSYGKEKVEYEVNANDVNGCSYTYCKLINDINNNGDADIGDEISCMGENFFVVPNDSTVHPTATDDNITLFAKYNLDVGNIYDKDGNFVSKIENPTGIQSSNSKGYASGENSYYGVIPFSAVVYWHDHKNLSYGLFIYDSNSDLYKYVENYKLYIINLGIDVKEASLIGTNQLIHSSIGCTNNSCINAPDWVYSSSYWTGSQVVGFSEYLMTVKTTGEYSASNSYYRDGTKFGIRPVIIIPKYEIK